MGIYSHLSDDQLTTTRDRLTQALTDRLANPSTISSADRRVQFDNAGQSIAEIRKALADINAEFDRRTGKAAHRPIYLV